MKPPYLPILDGHNDALKRLYDEHATPRSFLVEGQRGHIDLPRAKSGGLAGGFFAIFTPSPPDSAESDPFWELTFTADGYRQKLRSPIDPAYAEEWTDRLIEFLGEIETEAGGALQVVRDVHQLERSIAEEVFAVILHVEGAEAIREDLSNLEAYYARGVRSLGLVWSRPNAFGEGVPFCFPHSPDTGPGLTAAGRELVKECNRLGILIDLAHLNEKGFWDVERLSTSPLVVTHADVYAICPSTRNLTDDQLAAIGESGGVVGINFETMNIREDGLPEDKTPLSQIVRHIAYVAEKIGVDHVAFGSDFDGADMPGDLKDASGLPRLVDALRSGGFSAEEIEKITCRNWLRVLRATWR